MRLLLVAALLLACPVASAATFDVDLQWTSPESAKEEGRLRLASDGTGNASFQAKVSIGSPLVCLDNAKLDVVVGLTNPFPVWAGASIKGPESARLRPGLVQPGETVVLPAGFHIAWDLRKAPPGASLVYAMSSQWVRVQNCVILGDGDARHDDLQLNVTHPRGRARAEGPPTPAATPSGMDAVWLPGLILAHLAFRPAPRKP